MTNTWEDIWEHYIGRFYDECYTKEDVIACVTEIIREERKRWVEEVRPMIERIEYIDPFATDQLKQEALNKLDELK